MPKVENSMIEDKTRQQLLDDLTAAGFDDVTQVGTDQTDGSITIAVYRCSYRLGDNYESRNCQMQINASGNAAWDRSSYRWIQQVSGERRIGLEVIWPEYVEAVKAGYNIGGNDGTVLARWPDESTVQIVYEQNDPAKPPPQRYGILQFQESVASGSVNELDPAASGTYTVITRRIIYNRYTTENRFSWRVYDFTPST